MIKRLLIVSLCILMLLMKGTGETGGKAIKAGPVVNGNHKTAVSPTPTPLPTPSAKPTSTPLPTPVPSPQPKRLSIVAVGDVMLGRGVGTRLRNKDKGYLYAFEEVFETLNSGDIVFCNLEAPITDRTHSLYKSGKIVLKSSVASFEAIKQAGFNVISLANNHTMDYYAEGLMDTIDILDENNILYAGAGKNLEEARKPAVMEVDGMKVGILAYSDMAHYVFAGDPYVKFEAEAEKPGIAPTNIKYILEDIEKLKDRVDILILSLHWGVEESFVIPEEQRNMAHMLIDGGADLILGHHTHQFQGIEMYKGKPIVYSMGNFIFDQNDPENQESFILKLNYEDSILKSFTGIPVRTIGKCRVTMPKGDEAMNILKRQVELCRRLGTESVIDMENDILKIQLLKSN